MRGQSPLMGGSDDENRHPIGGHRPPFSGASLRPRRNHGPKRVYLALRHNQGSLRRASRCGNHAFAGPRCFNSGVFRTCRGEPRRRPKGSVRPHPNANRRLIGEAQKRVAQRQGGGDERPQGLCQPAARPEQGAACGACAPTAPGRTRVAAHRCRRSAPRRSCRRCTCAVNL